jgi:uncharacterized protein
MKYIVGIIILFILAYTFLGGETQKKELNSTDYTAQINKERNQKDSFYKTSDDSPISDKSSFLNLNYFEPNLKYRIEATIDPYTQKDNKASISMSNGTTEIYEKYGHARFTINNSTYSLLIYKHKEGLSVMFKDATSPTETYGGGRYLDFKEDEISNQKLIIDFNLAYNPYCAYNDDYACPIPPKENILPIRIEAGEKNFGK